MILIIISILLIPGILSSVIHNLIRQWKRTPHIYHQQEYKDFNPFQLDVKNSKPHSHRCLPEIEETKKLKLIEAVGYMSKPYITKGDYLICNTYRGPNVKLKFTKVTYFDKPCDMYIAELKLVKILPE
jgi:hypothetical protein